MNEFIRFFIFFTSFSMLSAGFARANDIQTLERIDNNLASEQDARSFFLQYVNRFSNELLHNNELREKFIEIGLNESFLNYVAEDAYRKQIFIMSLFLPYVYAEVADVLPPHLASQLPQSKQVQISLDSVVEHLSPELKSKVEAAKKFFLSKAAFEEKFGGPFVKDVQILVQEGVAYMVQDGKQVPIGDVILMKRGQKFFNWSRRRYRTWSYDVPLEDKEIFYRIATRRNMAFGGGLYVSSSSSDSAGFGTELSVFTATADLFMLEVTSTILADELQKYSAGITRALRNAGISLIKTTDTWSVLISANPRLMVRQGSMADIFSAGPILPSNENSLPLEYWLLREQRGENVLARIQELEVQNARFIPSRIKNMTEEPFERSILLQAIAGESQVLNFFIQRGFLTKKQIQSWMSEGGFCQNVL